MVEGESDSGAEMATADARAVTGRVVAAAVAKIDDAILILIVVELMWIKLNLWSGDEVQWRLWQE